MNEFVSYQVDEGVATLTLNNGKVNAISVPVLEAFNKALSRAADDRAVVIITGQPGMFSVGYDLKVLKSGPQDAADLVSAGSLFSRRMLAHPVSDHRRLYRPRRGRGCVHPAFVRLPMAPMGLSRSPSP